MGKQRRERERARQEGRREGSNGRGFLTSWLLWLLGFRLLWFHAFFLCWAHGTFDFIASTFWHIALEKEEQQNICQHPTSKGKK